MDRRVHLRLVARKQLGARPSHVSGARMAICARVAQTVREGWHPQALCAGGGAPGPVVGRAVL
eukprot:3764179-Rhodomonas_salina.1